MSGKQLKRGLSLTAKFNLVTIILILMTAVSITAFVLREVRKYSYLELLNGGVSLAESLAQQSEYGIYTEDAATLLQVLQSASLGPDVAYLAVLNANKRILVSTPGEEGVSISSALYARKDAAAGTIHEDRPIRHSKFNIFDILTPVTSHETIVSPSSAKDLKAEAVPIGYIQIGLSQKGIGKRFNQFYTYTLIVTLMVIVIGILVTVVTTKRITSPIKDLTRAAINISGHRYDQGIETTAGGELFDLTLAFNTMLEKLKEYRSQVDESTTELLSANKKMQVEIGERQSAEKALKAAHDELEVRVRDRTSELEKIVGDLRAEILERQRLEGQLRQSQKMEAVGHLAGGIAHDFNNLLTAILGYSEILMSQMEPDDPRQLKMEQIVSASQKAATLTQSLLAFSRKQIINPNPVDLNAIIQNAVVLLRRLISEDMELEVETWASPLVVLVDASLIEQVLMNLVTNARDAMGHGGRITVRSSRVHLDEDDIKDLGFGTSGEYGLLSVEDTGLGMDNEVLEKLFEPFFTTKEKGRGTGLGLSIVYGIVKQHKGVIIVESELGKGSTFKVYLPATDRERESRGQEVERVVEGGSETLLVAEDDVNVRNFMQEVLEDSGYKVIVAADGEEAIVKYRAERERVDLFISDVVMPNKSGKEAFEAMKKLNPNLKVLFLSGYATDVLSEKEFFKGGVTFMPKPVRQADLLRKIRELLDGQSPEVTS